MSSSFAPLDDDAPHWKDIYELYRIHVLEEVVRRSLGFFFSFFQRAAHLLYTFRKWRTTNNHNNWDNTITNDHGEAALYVYVSVRVSAGGDALTRACILCRILLLLL